MAFSSTNWAYTMDTKANQRIRETTTTTTTRGTDVNYGWPTSRTYPRTVREAFPNDAENAQWWYPPEQRWQDKIFFWLSVALWVVLVVYLWKTI